MASTVPPPTFGSRGFEVPEESAILTAVKSDLNTAFGGDLNMADETPQGQLASTLTAILGYVNDTFLKYSQQLDPMYATGREQDALARIYFIERIGAEPTAVEAVCTGAQGTVIPVNAIAIATDGNLYLCQEDGTIPLSGTITLPFVCATLGPVPCPAASLSSIYRAIPGWDTITNPGAGTLGRDTETRVEFEERRYRSVAKNSLGALPSILGSVLDIPGVLDGYVVENFTGSPAIFNGFTLAAHSVYVAAIGAADQDIAKAIWTKKAPGCAMNGNTTITVYDDENYDPPYPSYSIQFERPDSLAIIFAVSIANTAQVPSDAADQIKTAIINAFAGTDGGPRARIGSKLYASRYYGAVAALGAWVQIIAIDIGSANGADAEFTADIADTTMTVSAVASGTLAVNQSVVGANLLPGTTIVSQDSGTPGSTGTYTVSKSQTIASQTMYGVVPNDNSIQVQVDQAPTVSPDDIFVTAT